MIEIKCVGFNEKRIHPQQFYSMFINECRLVGRIVKIATNGIFAAALVVKEE